MSLIECLYCSSQCGFCCLQLRALTDIGRKGLAEGTAVRSCGGGEGGEEGDEVRRPGGPALKGLCKAWQGVWI